MISHPFFRSVDSDTFVRRCTTPYADDTAFFMPSTVDTFALFTELTIMSRSIVQTPCP